MIQCPPIRCKKQIIRSFKICDNAMENQGAKVNSERPGPIRIINTQLHPLFRDTVQCRLQIGEIQLVDNPDIVTGQKVEIWQFRLWNENVEREMYSKCYGRLLKLLKTTYSECRETGRLRADSANVVHFFEWGFTSPLKAGMPPEFQVIAEWCTGGNFTDAAKHYVPIHVIRQWLYEMLCGLDFLHKNRIVHHNLHSRIIYFTQANFKGTVKIGGFNHRRQLEVGPNDLAIRGDINSFSADDGRFVAPELVKVCDDYDIGRRSDIWSVGCVALHLLTGQPPLYVGARNRPIRLEMAVLYCLNGADRSPDERRPFILESLPKRTKDFVLRCLEFDPKERPLVSELLEKNGPLFFFHATPDNPGRYQNQEMKVLPRDTLNYWAKDIKVPFGDLGDDMRTDDLYLDVQEIRECIHDVLHKSFNTGSIYLENIGYYKNGESTIIYSLKNTTSNLLSLWNKWLEERSPNVAYIPPECLAALPHSTGDTSKVDSWAVGCLLIHLLKRGQPLTLKRFLRNSSEKVNFELREEPLLESLQRFYTTDGEQGLVIGPAVPPIPNTPAACKDFLAHSLKIDAATRSSLAELRAHPFVDLSKSLDKLCALENQSAETFSVGEGTIRIIDTKKHPFFYDTALCRLQIGDVQLTANPGMATGQMAEIWRFQLANNNKNREIYAKTVEKLLNLLEATDKANKRLGSLQNTNAHVTRFFGWQFAAPMDPRWLPEFRVFAELCRGGNFQDAAAYSLPLNMIQKLLYEMLCGLDFLHRHRTAHSNLNSRMIFFTGANFTGTVKIGGFHIVRLRGEDRTIRPNVRASSGEDGRFVAPELSYTCNNYDIGRQSNMWSVGCVALHLLTGAPPLYTGHKNQPLLLEEAILYHLNTFGKLPNIPNSLPKCAKNFVLRCLKFNREKRLLASELLASNGPLSRFNNDPDNPRRYQNQEMKALSQDTLDYWTKKTHPGLSSTGSSSAKLEHLWEEDENRSAKDTPPRHLSLEKKKHKHSKLLSCFMRS
ncbi:uncharacterized protein LOC129597458 [Paramacrobiotus metropolitanus]|uniref:uncharacterized protein LOC129597458 n=1 Tax=Paramacrobiotus metropolitanus TaxID=2943436 RepID=UPI0024461D33|nr:uncharacterized protein LOC129597458 [Paramacrobiotus metropolitanus]